MIDEGAASCPIKRPSILDVNLSSLIVPSLKDTVNVRRTVTNVGPENSKYEAIIEPPPGITIKEIKYQGSTEDRLVLLKGVSGDFWPVVLIASFFVLIALMGVSGAGKTTLMDVLAGRKAGGYVNGDIKISGYPKKQETFVEKMKKQMRRTLKNVKILDGFCNLF
ncbi:hypothetical protein CQW23_29571 [Capsicum baccatum]|uniref:ABC transporter domain-containing protein n=1 Tax=Capsicum baccatum TaxID=33114 RepID=A0A2G2VJT1_CAPBA|nr:hypothetical protein CQW23_29571 [Capsicum baccatum]